MIPAIGLVLSLGSGTAQMLRQLRFSPDGHYVLAQDNSRITVLTVEPFAILFQIPSKEAEVAQFMPDSREIVFITSNFTDPENALSSRTGVERWSVSEHTRADFKQIVSAGCDTKRLSPDGAVWVCVDYKGTVRVIDVASGETMFEKKQLNKLYLVSVNAPDEFPQKWAGDLGHAGVDFSPDSRFVVVRGGSVIAWDLRKRRQVRQAGALKYLKRQSVFVAPDRAIVWRSLSAKDGRVTAGLVAVPSGKVVSNLKVPWGGMSPATDPGFVIIRGLRQDIREAGHSWMLGAVDAREYVQSWNRSAVVNLTNGQVTFINSSRLDVFGRFLVAERGNGEAGLYEIDEGDLDTVLVPRVTVDIPRE